MVLSERKGNDRKKSEAIGRNRKKSEEIGRNRKQSEAIGKLELRNICHECVATLEKWEK